MLILPLRSGSDGIRLAGRRHEGLGLASLVNLGFYSLRCPDLSTENLPFYGVLCSRFCQG